LVQSISDVPQEHKEHASDVLQELSKNGSPKELSLSLENQLGVATDEIAQCFYFNEDGGAVDNPDGISLNNADDGERETVQKTLKDVHRRLLVVLKTHSQGEHSCISLRGPNWAALHPVLNRLTYRKGTAGIIMAQNFAERLDQLMAELLLALQAGESLSVQDMRGMLSALAEWCRSVFLWARNLKASNEELDNLRVSQVFVQRSAWA
jgi:hypothetical protein